MPDTARYYRVKASQHAPGDHVHVGIWAGTWRQARDRSRPKLGQLIMDVHDWTGLVRLLTWAPGVQLEVDTDGMLDFDGTGDADADMHLAGFRGFDGCPRGDCTAPGLCSEKGDCLDVDVPAPASPRARVRPFPALLGEAVHTGDAASPTVDYQVPDTQDRVWADLGGEIVPLPGSTGWAVTVYVDGHPVKLILDDWRPGPTPVKQMVRWADWIAGTPGQTYELTTRLDGALWDPSVFIPTAIRITNEPPPPPWDPLARVQP